MAAGKGEMQAEVHHVTQMGWHLNKLPSGMPGLKDVNLDKLDSFPLNGRAGRKKGMPMVHKVMPMAHLLKIAILPILVRQQNYRWTVDVLAHDCPLSRELTSYKHSRIRCS